MINSALFRREMRASVKALLIFAGVMAMYFAVIVTMFDPELGEVLDQFVLAMPELMAMFGMSSAGSTLVGFLASYLYGFLMAALPMVFTIMCANRLVARHVDRGSMAWLMAAPVKRSCIAASQMACLVCCVVVLMVFCAVFGAVCAEIYFPGELDYERYVLVNAGAISLQLFIAGLCFLSSCVFDDARRATAVGAGIPSLMIIVQMAAKAGPELDRLKYFTFFTLFSPEGIAAGQRGSMAGSAVLLAGAVVLFAAAYTVFCKRDMYI